MLSDVRSNLKLDAPVPVFADQRRIKASQFLLITLLFSF